MSVGTTASSSGSPSPNTKAKHRAKQNDYYRLVEEVFQEYSIVRSFAEMPLDHHHNINDKKPYDDMMAPIIPRSRLPLACSRLRLSFAPSEIATLMESSRSSDGLDRDEFVQLVHDNLGRRTTAEEVIFNVVQLNPIGEMTAEELREFLLSDALYTIDRRAEPLNDEEFDMFMDQLDPLHRGLVHVGRFVRVMCPDESESVIERLLEKYGVGESRRQSQREHLMTLESVGRTAMRDWASEELAALTKRNEDDAAHIQYMERQRAAREAAEQLQREQEARLKAEEAARRAEEEARRAAEDARKRREMEEAERARRAAEAEAARLKAAEEERRRQEKELQRLRKEKAEAGCCRVDYSK